MNKKGTKQNPTLLIISPDSTRTKDAIFSLMVAETGEVLYQHLCSSAGWAKGDLYSNREDRQKEVRKRFGVVEIKFRDETDITLDELVERNTRWAKENGLLEEQD